MLDGAEPPEPESQSVKMLVAELPRGAAFAFTTPEGDRVCIVDREAAEATEAHENAHRAFWRLLAP